MDCTAANWSVGKLVIALLRTPLPPPPLLLKPHIGFLKPPLLHIVLKEIYQNIPRIKYI